jgi:hypothetical protein
MSTSCQTRIASADAIAASERVDLNGVEIFDRGDAMGKSVRTLRAFSRGEIVCSYGGREIVDWSQVHATDYAYQVSKNLIVDGNPKFPESNGHAGAFINDACGPIRSAGLVNNVYFSNGFVRAPDGGKLRAIWLRAKFNIPAGAELFLSYGQSYWQRNEHRMPTKRRGIAVAAATADPY